MRGSVQLRMLRLNTVFLPREMLTFTRSKPLIARDGSVLLAHLLGNALANFETKPVGSACEVQYQAILGSRGKVAPCRYNTRPHPPRAPLHPYAAQYPRHPVSCTPIYRHCLPRPHADTRVKTHMQEQLVAPLHASTNNLRCTRIRQCQAGPDHAQPLRTVPSTYTHPAHSNRRHP